MLLDNNFRFVEQVVPKAGTQENDISVVALLQELMVLLERKCWGEVVSAVVKDAAHKEQLVGRLGSYRRLQFHIDSAVLLTSGSSSISRGQK